MLTNPFPAKGEHTQRGGGGVIARTHGSSNIFFKSNGEGRTALHSHSDAHNWQPRPMDSPHSEVLKTNNCMSGMKACSPAPMTAASSSTHLKDTRAADSRHRDG